MSISLVAGLGNPGREYAGTRHNLGAVIVEALAARHALRWEKQPRFSLETARWEHAPGRSRWLVKPLTYMNESGAPIAGFARYHRMTVDEVVAVYDDVGLPLGRVKVTVAGSAGGHNGVDSLIAHLGADFTRYRLGIGPREPAAMDLKDFVLEHFSPTQLTTLSENLGRHLDGLELLLESGVARAMNSLNRKEPNEPDQA